MKRNKWFILAVFICVLNLIVAGCSSKKEDTASKKEVNTPEKKTITWKMQSNSSPPEEIMGYWGGYGQAAEIARRVKERTNGAFDIKIYPAGALFKANESGDAVKNGAIEMLASNGLYQTGMVPEAIMEYGLPYGTKDSATAAEVFMNPEFLNVLKNAYAKHNIYFLGLSSTSCSNYMTNFPIRKLEDLKGKPISGSGITAEVIKYHGGVPANIAHAERYMAMQRGTVQGTIFPSYAGITYKYYEVLKYQSWPSVFTVITNDYLVNMDAWNKLPKEYQDILQDEVTKMAKFTYTESGPALEKIGREESKNQYNVENIDLTNEEIEKFQKAVQPLWDSMAAKSDGCAQLVKIAKETAGLK